MPSIEGALELELHSYPRLPTATNSWDNNGLSISPCEIFPRGMSQGSNDLEGSMAVHAEQRHLLRLRY